MVFVLLIFFVWAVLVGFIELVAAGIWFVVKLIVHLAQGDRPE